MPGVELNSVAKSFGPVKVIHGVDLQIDEGEFTVFVGPVGLRQVDLAEARRRT